MAHSKAFVHPPLDLATDQIRLLSIQPGEPIRCTLETYDPGDQKEYIALSYTWGPESPEHDIEINGSDFSVRQNLFDFLVVASSKHAGKLFWIDQICINQSNTGERNHQVMRMSRIYEDAACVYAWLGAEANNSDEAMDLIENLTPTNNDTSLPLNLAYSKPDGIRELLDRPYWRRLWVVQEVVLARRVIVLCGFLQTSLDSFHNLILKIRERGFGMRLNMDFTSLLEMQGNGHHHSVQDFNDDSVPPCIKIQRIEHERDAELTAVANFRQKVYVCRHFKCADPRDKIWGLAGLHPDGPKRLQIDYSRTKTEAFWDFFTSHLCGIDHVTDIEGFRHIFPTRYVLEDWWYYVNTLMSCMDLDSDSLYVRVAQVLEKTFQELQAAWLARGTLKPEQIADVSAFFAEYLPPENVMASPNAKPLRRVYCFTRNRITTVSPSPIGKYKSLEYTTSSTGKTLLP